MTALPRAAGGRRRPGDARGGAGARPPRARRRDHDDRRHPARRRATTPTTPARASAPRSRTRTAPRRHGLTIELVPGGELDALHAVELDDDALTALKLGGGPYLLLECGSAGRSCRRPPRALAGPPRPPDPARPPRAQPGVPQAPRGARGARGGGMLAQVTAGRSPVASDAPCARSPTRCSTAVSCTSPLRRPRTDPPGDHRGRAPSGRDRPRPRLIWLTREMPAAVLAGTPLSPPISPPDAPLGCPSWPSRRP